MNKPCMNTACVCYNNELHNNCDLYNNASCIDCLEYFNKSKEDKQ